MKPYPDDPRIRALQHTLEQHPATAVSRRPEDREAAVAVLVRPHDELEILLIKRAEHEQDPWSGHMALPGGRRAATDADLIATALRETEEETHVPLRRIGALLGRLDEVAPATPRLPPLMIAPFVLGVPPGTQAAPDGREVDATLWVPISALRDEGAVSELLVELGEGGSRRFPSLNYGEYVIWGLTHRILTQFLGRVEEAGL